MKPGRPSETAVRIAITRVAACADADLRALVADPDEPFSRWFVEAHSPMAVQALQRRLASDADPARDRIREQYDPGGEEYHLLRKRFVEDEVRVGLEAGAERVVLLGAGYDTLALRLAPAFPRVRFFELDHPDTQAVKRRALEAHAAVSPAVTLVPADLASGSAEEALTQAGFRPGTLGVFVAEGLLPYLPAEAVDGLFAAARRLAGPGSRFVLTMVDSADLADASSEMARNAKVAALWGEPIRSSHDARAVAEYLQARGFRLLLQADSAELRRRYLEPLGLDRPVGMREFLVVAEGE